MKKTFLFFLLFTVLLTSCTVDFKKLTSPNLVDTSDEKKEVINTAIPQEEKKDDINENDVPEGMIKIGDDITIEVTPEEMAEMDEIKIKQAFADKYNKAIEDVELTISENTGFYAKGGIRFEGEIAGAMWLAHKETNNKWTIVFDGNGTIPCESLEQSNFPTEIAPECWDETSQTLVQR